MRSSAPCMPGWFLFHSNMDSENRFCSKGWSCCPSEPVTNGVSFDCEKCWIFLDRSVANNFAGEVTERHPEISPSESWMGTSIRSRPLLLNYLPHSCLEISNISHRQKTLHLWQAQLERSQSAIQRFLHQNHEWELLSDQDQTKFHLLDRKSVV